MKRILSALALYVFTYSLTFAQDFIDDNPLSPTDAPEMAVLATLDRIEQDSMMLKIILAEYDAEDIEASNPYLLQRIKAAETHAQQARWYYEKIYPKMIETYGLELASKLLVKQFQQNYISDIREVISDVGDIEVTQQTSEEITGDAPRELDQTLDITSNDPPLRRDLFNDEIANSCEENGSPDECVETFEAAANVVAVVDPNKGGAAEWTGRKAKEVSDDLVKLGGTQEQLMDVIKISTDNVKFIEKTLPASTRIDGPKEAAALNLVKTSLNLMKLKPATRTVIDDPAGCGSDPNFNRCSDPPEIAAMSLARRIGSPTINRLVIGPVMHKYEKQVELLGIDSGLDLPKSTGPVSRNTETDSVVAFQGIVAATSVAVQAATQGYEESKKKEANRQNDAPTIVQQVEPQVQAQQQQVVQQQQQQQQQQNCNPQFQDC